MCAIIVTPARAESVDDIATLAQRNAGEDVMLATVDKSANEFNLSAADIIKLKNANVPNTVITAMLKHHASAAQAPVQAQAAPQPAPAPAAPLQIPDRDLPAPSAPAAAAAHAAPLPGDGTLEIENLDTSTWSYRYEPAISTIWIVPPTSQSSRGNVAPNGGVTLRMASGVYNVRYPDANKDEGATLTVNGGQKSQLLLTRTTTDQLDALYVSVFENGEKRAGGRLIAFRMNGPVQRNSQAAPQSIQPPTVVEAPTYVQPQTTIIYRDPPVVYYPYRTYAPYYYYPRSAVNFGYFHGGRRSSVGIGFGF